MNARTRQADNLPTTLIASVMRWRGIATMVYMGSASLATGLVLAWKFAPRLTGLEGRATAIEIHATLIDAKLDSLRQGTGFLFRKACLDLTQADQQFLDVRCPPNIYKGAPRSVVVP